MDDNGFTARAVVPPCISADFSTTQIAVPYIVWRKTVGTDYFAEHVELTSLSGSSKFNAQSHSYDIDAWDPLSVRHHILVENTQTF